MIKMETHEVVVVGAGPAGLKAAELLGKAGKDVLVVERDEEKKIGDKPCAGGLPPHAMKYFPEELFENVVSSATLWVGDRKLVVDLNEPLVACIPPGDRAVPAEACQGGRSTDPCQHACEGTG